MRKLIALASLIAVFGIVVSANAATTTVWTGAEDNAWQNDNNWTNGAPPQNPPSPYSSWYANIGKDSSGSPGLAIISEQAWAANVQVGGTYSADGAAELILASGDYTVDFYKKTWDDTGYLMVGKFADATTAGTVNQYGGNLTLGYYSTAKKDISLSIGGGGLGYYTIYGGSIYAKGYLNLGRSGGTGHFTVVGSGANSIKANGFNMSSTSTLTFEINGNGNAGITTIEIVDDYFDGDVSFAGTDNIIVDISAGGPFASSYTLMTWTGSESGTPSLVLPDNWTWNSDTWQTDNQIIVTVPEPTTLVLVLIGMGAHLGIIRKKKRLS